MPEVLDWRSAADPRPLVHRAAKALAEGELVAFPTDTVYVLAASALIPEAVEKICQCKMLPVDRPLTLVVRGAGEALDWAPGMSPLGRRLARRCWPGPVTLVFAGAEQGLTRRLPESVRSRVCPSGSVGLRAPAHRAILSALPGPARSAGANQCQRDRSPARNDGRGGDGGGWATRRALSSTMARRRLGRSSTVVRVNGSSSERVA